MSEEYPIPIPPWLLNDDERPPGFAFGPFVETSVGVRVLYHRGAALRIMDLEEQLVSTSDLRTVRTTKELQAQMFVNRQMDARAARIGGLTSVQWVH